MSATPVEDGARTVSIGGRDVHVRIEGAADAPWVILSNSIATDLGVWDGIVPALAQRYRLLRYDTRGHGRSAPVDLGEAESVTFADFAADAIALLDHFGIELADFIGLSLGGVTAWGVALAAPSRFRSLVIAGSRADMPPPMVQAWTDRIATVRSGGMAAERDATLARWFTADYRRVQPKSVARIATMIEETSPGGFVAGASALRKLDYLPRLAEIAHPTLLMAGGGDGVMPDMVVTLAQRMPHAEHAVIPGGGHLLPVDSPAATAERILRFLAARS